MIHRDRPVRRLAGVFAGVVAIVICAGLSACSSGATTAIAATTSTPVSVPTTTPVAGTRVVSAVASALISAAPASAAPASAVPASAAPASAGPASTANAAATSPAPTNPAPTNPAPTKAGAGGPTCTDLTAAAASAAVGKATTVTLEQSVAATPGLSICDITIAGEVYPVQLSVDAAASPAGFAAEEQAAPKAKPLAGVGDKAFSSSIGVEALLGTVDIAVTGPAGPVLGGNFTVPTAIVKAMIAALK